MEGEGRSLLIYDKGHADNSGNIQNGRMFIRFDMERASINTLSFYPCRYQCLDFFDSFEIFSALAVSERSLSGKKTCLTDASKPRISQKGFGILKCRDLNVLEFGSLEP